MTTIQIEQKMMRCKVIAVMVGGEFRLKRPDHEFTALFAELEQNLYEVTEAFMKLKAGHEMLLNHIEGFDDKPTEVLEINEEAENLDAPALSSEEWASRPLQTKTPF